MIVPFNRVTSLSATEEFIQDVLESGNLSGDKKYTKLCHGWFTERFGFSKSLLTPSCTHALEMAAILIGIEPGDEVIMPSYTFVSTANAFILRGAKVVFVDVKPDTMNIDEDMVEKAITQKTKAIVPVHYAGISCDMDRIMDIAERFNLYVVEDAAQAMMSTYKGRPLGSIGHLAAYSFHETKNYTSGGEGGLLIINDDRFLERAEIIREKGTDRSKFLRGEKDKYTWVDIGSSYLPSELQAAYLYSQLLSVDEINSQRLSIWESYNNFFENTTVRPIVSRMKVPVFNEHNAHMYYVQTSSNESRDFIISALKKLGVSSVFHYVPLHSTHIGKENGYFYGEDKYTSTGSDTLIRLPLWFGMTQEMVDYVIQSLKAVCK